MPIARLLTGLDDNRGSTLSKSWPHVKGDPLTETTASGSWSSSNFSEETEPSGPERPKPLVIGIIGGTGAGKTTIARAIIAEMPAGSVAMIPHDAYYKNLSEQSYEDRCKVNFDHPDSLDNDLLVAHLDMLIQGESIERPVYDFATHLRADYTVHVTSTPVLVVEGILLFSDARLRERFDIKLFVDTPSDIRVLRRIRRDMEQRGRTFQDIRKQYYETVRPMHEAFVEPGRQMADLIIPEGGNHQIAIDLISARMKQELMNRGWR